MKNLVKIFLLTSSFLFILPFAWRIEAASLKFDKSTISVASGGTFQIAVNVDPASDSITGTDIYVSHDSTLLKATAVSAGSLFPTVINDISTTGKVYIAGMVNDPASPISTSGTVATITFQALKDGTATLSFDCNTSKIIKDDINSSNVISCSTNGTSVVTIGSGGGGTTPTSAAPISELPESGVFDNVAKFVIPGTILLILGSALRLVL